MPQRSSVTIVASPRPRVGKTLLARILVDFHLHEGRPVAGFDLNGGEDTLAQFLPEHATAATIGDVNGQMALFDRLIADDGVAKVSISATRHLCRSLPSPARSVWSRKRASTASSLLSCSC